MSLVFRFVIHNSWAFFIFMLGACGPEMPPAGVPHQGNDNTDDWLVSGKMSSTGYGDGEIVAIGMDGNRYRSTIAPDQNFDIELPGNSTYAIYFVPAKPRGERNIGSASEFIDTMSGPKNTKTMPALLMFEDSFEIGLRNTLRLPKVITNRYLDLGEIDIKNRQAFPTNNPSSILDFDSDGINDFADQDDQNDGLSDKMQRDQLERVEICHFTSKNTGSTQNIPLSGLYEHMEHGDTFGPCINSKGPAVTSEKEENNEPMMPPPAAAPQGNTGRMGTGSVVIEETPDEGEEGNTDEEKDENKGDDKASDDKADDGKSGDDKPEDDKAGDDKAGDDKAGDDKVGDGKAGDETPEKPAPKKPKKPRKPKKDADAEGGSF
jgi:hypothetical protein